jgi:hypothetical protein
VTTTTTSTAVVRTMRCTECGKLPMWCECRSTPAKTYTRRGRHEIGVLVWCRHDRRGTLGCFPLDSPLTQQQMIVETAQMAQQCECIVALIGVEGEQEKA